MDWFLVLCFVNFLLPSHGFSNKIFLELHREPPPPESKSSSRKYSEEWIDQWLDHSNAQDDRKWKMRYFANDEFYQEGGPIFIFVGGEWTATPEWVTGGHTFDMAKQFKGYLLYTEHRFYGKSRPTSDLSVDNLRYLTSHQALADLAHFIQNKTQEIPGAEESPVFLVGASYSASLVTWFSHRYPTLVTGAWASSAPLLAKVDFEEYFEVVVDSLLLVGGEDCYNKTVDAFTEMENIINADDIVYLSQIMNLCDELTTDELDTQNFFQTMSSVLAVVVQNYAPDGIQEYCSHMNTHDDPIEGYAKHLRKFVGSGCLTVNFEDDNKELQSTSWPQDENNMMRQWLFQTCNEFGWYQTSTSPKTSFTENVPVDFFIQLCQYLFGEEFSAEKIEHNTCLTNAKFGGLEPQVKYVYSTHGELDPWRAAGTQEDLNPDSLTIILPNLSHCSDLRSLETSDSVELYQSKQRITALVKKWGDL